MFIYMRKNKKMKNNWQTRKMNVYIKKRNYYYPKINIFIHNISGNLYLDANKNEKRRFLFSFSISKKFNLLKLYFSHFSWKKFNLIKIKESNKNQYK